MKSRFSIIILYILLFLFQSKTLFPFSDIKVLSSSASGIVVEFIPDYNIIEDVKLNNQLYKRISFSYGIVRSEERYGYPQVPSRIVDIAIPDVFSNTIQIIASEFNIIDGNLIPSPKPIKVDGYLYSDYELNNRYYEYKDDNIVTFDESGIAREILVQSFKINPIQFDPVTSKIRLYKKIVFKVSFSKPLPEIRIRNNRDIPQSILNYDLVKNIAKEQVKLPKASKNSVLANGTWYRFETPEEGVYKISYNDLNNVGIDAASVDPRTIKIYNNGGKNLREEISLNAPTDLVENSILVNDEEDGVFNQNDYILFYGRSVNFWEYDLSDQKINRNRNYSSKKNYYWITSGGLPGKRMETESSLSETADIMQDRTLSFNYLEEDNINIGKSGRDYWGDEFNSSVLSKTYLTTLEGIISGSKISYNFRLANASSPSTLLTIEENGNSIYSRTLSGYGSQSYKWGRVHSGIAFYNNNLPEDRSVLKFSFSFNSFDSRTFLDYYEIEFNKYLKSFNDQLIFFSYDTSAVIEYQLYNFSNSNIEVYNISNFSDVKTITGTVISGGELRFKVNEEQNKISKYLATTSDSYKSIQNIEPIDNSNIHGILNGGEYVIITHRNFQEHAERLANFRANHPSFKLSSVVVYIDEIFNEFSGGMLDPTGIRNFVKYAFNNWEIKPFFVLLFGDGTYDYFDVEKYGLNFIPTYQTRESLDELYSFPYDDYYSRIVGDDLKPDVAMGRINVLTPEDARVIVDKIIYYESDSERGLWRNRATLVGDDGLTSKGDEGSIHTGQAERLANKHIPEYIDKNKIFLSMFPTEISGLGRRKPGVNEAIVDAVNNGTLLLNYTGHGNPDVWSHEVVFERTATLPLFKNKMYFFLTAATCDFGRYDNPNIISGTEEMMFLEDRGSIGTFSSARLVFASENAAINELFYSKLFNDSLSSSGRMTLGEALYLTKQTRTRDNDEKFHLFCDPALSLNLPDKFVTIDNVNNKDLSLDVQISALSQVSIEGSIRNSQSEVNTNFNGEGIISIFDSEKKKFLQDINFEIVEQGGVIFRGRVSVNNGEFSTSFRVPKDISYENKNGKIIAYMFDEQSEGIGFTNKIVVGGTDSTAVDDGEGPEIEIYFDDTSYENSYLINPDFDLIVLLSDDTGLNTTGTGVGHKLEGVLDDDEENSIDFSDHFIGDLDAGGKSGRIKFRFTEVEKGDHNVIIKAWDIFNNRSVSESYFTVVDSDKLTVRDVVNYPNPFSSNTTFTFQHNMNNPINVKIKIYTIAGRLINEIKEKNILDKFVRIDWDGSDSDGSSIANGTYLYKMIIESSDGDYKESILGKLAIFH
ncbi:type IX secretion system sortase PorU [Bacteroidota bacterium]